MSNENGAPAPAPVSHGKAMMFLGIIILGVAVYIGLASVLGMTSFYGGFLFIFYWTAIKHADLKEYWPCVVGGLTGLGLAWALHNLPLQFGTVGLVAALVGVLFVIYASIIGWVPLFVNMATMLFLTVGTIPALQGADEFRGFVLSVVYGAALIGVVMFAVARLKKPAANVAVTI